MQRERMDSGPVTEGSEKREEARKWWLRESGERMTCYTVHCVEMVITMMQQ